MKITKVDAFPIRVAPPLRDVNRQVDTLRDYGEYVMATDSWTSLYPKNFETCLVRVETDEGHVGWGESFSPVSSCATARIVEDLCRTVVLGHDPHDVGYLWYRSYSAMRERGHGSGFYVDAMSGVDQAIWDLLGHHHGLPVHKMIGGCYNKKIRVYAGIGGDDPAKMAATAAKLADLKYTAIKMHIRGENKQLIDIVSSVRSAIGDDIDIMVDVHTTKDVSAAITLGRAFEDYGVQWLEAPVAAEDADGHAKVAQALDMQVASGEWLRTTYEWKQWLEKGSVDCAMPDIGRTGISEGMRISQLCDVFNIPVSPHVGAGFILAVAAGIQVSAASPRFQILEHMHAYEKTKAVFATKYPKLVDGHFEVSDAPGLGVMVDEKRVKSLLIE